MQSPNAQHMDNEPIRSDENFHDDYNSIMDKVWRIPSNTKKNGMVGI